MSFRVDNNRNPFCYSTLGFSDDVLFFSSSVVGRVCGVSHLAEQLRDGVLRELGLWAREHRGGSSSRMWRTGGRAFSQLLQRVVASPPPPTHLRVLAAAVSCSPSRFNSFFHNNTKWRECEEGVAGFCTWGDSVKNGQRSSKDLRAAEAKFVEKICRVVKRGEWGIDTVNELEKLNIRLRSKLVNKVLRELDDPDVAHCFFQWARKQPSFHHSLQAYHAIIEITGAAQKFDTQNQLLQEMHRQGLQANTSTFNILLLGFSRANDTDRVVEMFNQMVQYGWSPNAFTFKCVIRSLVWSARASEALSMYTKMMEFGYVPDNFTYNGLIEGLCKAGYVDEAFVIFQEMEDRGLSPDAIAHAALIKGLDTKGRIDEACRMFEEMTGKNLRSVVNTHKGIMGVFSKRHKDDLSSNAASAGVAT